MEILSPVHGKITYDEDEIINFEKSIPGFNDIKRFILKEIEGSSFKLLQSIDDVTVGFVVISPFQVEEDYEINLSEEVIKTLEIKEATDVSGVILTKLDGTSKGGIVLAIRHELGIPIKYIGLGEGVEDLEVFDIEQYLYGLFADFFEE